MLIKFLDIVNKYGKPKGIIHIGSHLLEERNDYLSSGIENIIWVEANTKIYSKIKNSIKLNKKEKIYNFVITNEDEKLYNFYITNNGQSSSIFELDLHKKYYPDIYVTEIIQIKSKRMDTLINENKLDITNYNFINLDIQGAELLALKSFGDMLKKIEFIYTEINTNSIYQKCPLINEIDNYLNNFDFKRVETNLTEFEWGDALYVKTI